MKKKTQRLLAIFCMFALVLGLSACGKGEQVEMQRPMTL